jgi:hypothetical protein
MIYRNGGRDLNGETTGLYSLVAFASGLIPGSFHFSGIDCLELLRANELPKERKVYAMADEPASNTFRK